MEQLPAIPYRPRAQFMALHNRQQRFAGLVCHRRAGKTVACIAELVHRALYCKKPNARFAYIAPFYRQAKDAAWTYLSQMTGSFATHRVSELRVILPNGAWITLYGADNPDALRGLYFDGAILDEMGDMRPTLWAQVVLPTLMDRRGWAIFIGTPKGKNEFYRIIQRSRQDENWFHMTLKASESGLLSEDDLAEMRALQTEDEYAQEMECSFEAAVIGSYYAKIIGQMESNGHIAPDAVERDAAFPVHVAMDLGFTDSTAIWFWQQRPDGLAIIDYEEHHSEPLDYYFELLEDKPYEYETIWLPHDARAKTLQTGRSTIEQFLARGFPCAIAPQLSLQHGIDAARLILPDCYINQTNCYEGIEALRAYRRKYDDVNKAFSDKPQHDWSSHGSDAFRYLALVAQEYGHARARTPRPKTGDQSTANIARFTPLPPAEIKLEEMFRERESRANRRRYQRL